MSGQDRDRDPDGPMWAHITALAFFFGFCLVMGMFIGSWLASR